MVGESAGGYLAAAMLVRLRDAKRGPSFAAAALSFVAASTSSAAAAAAMS